VKRHPNQVKVTRMGPTAEPTDWTDDMRSYRNMNSGAPRRLPPAELEEKYCRPSTPNRPKPERFVLIARLIHVLTTSQRFAGRRSGEYRC